MVFRPLWSGFPPSPNGFSQQVVRRRCSKGCANQGHERLRRRGTVPGLRDVQPWTRETRHREKWRSTCNFIYIYKKQRCAPQLSLTLTRWLAPEKIRTRTSALAAPNTLGYTEPLIFLRRYFALETDTFVQARSKLRPSCWAGTFDHLHILPTYTAGNFTQINLPPSRSWKM